MDKRAPSDLGQIRVNEAFCCVGIMGRSALRWQMESRLLLYASSSAKDRSDRGAEDDTVVVQDAAAAAEALPEAHKGQPIAPLLPW